MTNPVRGPAGVSPAASHATGAPGATTHGRRFSDVLVRTSQDGGHPEPSDGVSVRDALSAAARSIAQGQELVDGAIRAARRGRTFSQEELIALQAGVYRYTQELEIASKLVDKSTSAVRQTLQSQQ